MRASILIPFFNQVALTRDCLAALGAGGAGGGDAAAAAAPGARDEIVLVDDGSTADVRGLAALPGVRYLRLARRHGFAGAINRGAAVARGDILVLLNNDTVPQPGWLEALCRDLDDPEVGVVGARLVYPGTHLIQHAGMVFGDDRLPHHRHRFCDAGDPAVAEQREVPCVTGACLAIRRQLFEAIGGLDEGYRNGCEDVDLCLASRQRGYRCLYEPAALALHYEGMSAGRYDHVSANTTRLLEKWGEELAASAAVRQGDAEESPASSAESPASSAESPAPSAESPASSAAPARRAAPPPIAAVAPRQAAPPGSLCWLGPLYDHTELAAAGRDVCLALARRGGAVRVCASDAPAADWVAGAGAADLALLRTLEVAAPGMADAVLVPFAGDGPERAAALPAGRRLFVRVDEVPWPGTPAAGALRGLAPRCTELWVPSATHRRELAAVVGSAAPIAVVPPGVDTDRFHPERAPLFIEGAHGFVFLAVLPWRRRAGWDLLLRAYLAAFAAEADVTLVIDTCSKLAANGDEPLLESIERAVPELLSGEECPDVVIVHEPLAPGDLPGLYAAADVLVVPSRGASGGRTLLQGLATGLPVLATDCAPHGDWLTPEVGALVPARAAPCEPDPVALRELLRAIASRPAWVESRRAAARARALEHWTLDHLAAAMRRRLRH